MEMISVKAFAKVNLLLNVKGKRPDGYHGIETLYRGISLHDDLFLSKRGDGIHLTCEGMTHKGLQPDTSNLAWQAARVLREAYPDKVGGVSIKLVKRIPVEAGLGGGSADAAAVLVGMDHLFALGLEPDVVRNIASQLGSDVPFCLAPLAAVGSGRGEILTPLESTALGPVMWIVLVKPPFGLSTKAVYSQWTLREGADTGNGRLDHILLGMKEGKTELIWGNMHNDLESPACVLDTRLAAYMDWIEGEFIALTGTNGMDLPGMVAGIVTDSEVNRIERPSEFRGVGSRDGRVLLCGSGSAVAVYLTDENMACILAENLRSGWDRLGEKSCEQRNSDSPDGQGSINHVEQGAPQIWVARTLIAEDIAARLEEVAPHMMH